MGLADRLNTGQNTPMPPSKKKIAKEISQIDNSGEALERLAAHAGYFTDRDLAKALSKKGKRHSANQLKPETVQNWFKGGKPTHNLGRLLDLFEEHGLLDSVPSDPTVRHIKFLLLASDRQIAHFVDGGLKTLVDQLLVKDKAWLDGTKTGGIRWTHSAQAADISIARRTLIDKVLEAIDRLDAIDDHADHIARLLRMQDWNDVQSLNLKVDYFEIAKAAILKIAEPEAHPAIALMSRFADLLFLDGKDAETDRLYVRISKSDQKFDDPKVNRLLRDKVDYVMLSTELEPDDVEPLFETGNKANDLYNKASAERCKGCRFIRQGNLDEGRTWLEKSRGTIGAIGTASVRSEMLLIYLDALALFADRQEEGTPIESIAQRANALLARVKDTEPDEKPLLAGLLSLKLEIRLKRLGIAAKDAAQDHQALILAIQINELLRVSIRNYCFFDLPSVHDDAKTILQSVEFSR